VTTPKTILILVSILLLGLSACGPTLLPTASPTPDPAQATISMQTQVAFLVAMTQAAQTQTSGVAATAQAQQTDIANAVAQTLTAVITDTPVPTLTPIPPTPTFSPSLTITRTLTPTPNYPRVTLGADTNCRSGPGLAYEIVGVVPAGTTAEIVGQDEDHGNWIIRLPSNPATLCWIWRGSATAAAGAYPVPVFTPPPTPTPALDFALTYDSYTTCNNLYLIKFKIVNNSPNLTWESNQVNVIDRTTNVTTTVNRNNFSNYNACVLVANDTNLEPGEVGITTSNSFAVNPNGHDFKATIQVCTQEGQSGICATKTITFVP
jgi:hypothetical protein